LYNTGDRVHLSVLVSQGSGRVRSGLAQLACGRAWPRYAGLLQGYRHRQCQAVVAVSCQ